MRKSVFVLALLVAAGCKGSDGVDPLVTTTVLVSTSATQISVNETTQASAIVRDQNGDPLTGKAIAWVSLNPTIASVDPTTGIITGVAPGNATIRGTVDGVTGTATVRVIAPVQSCVGGVTTVDLGVGQVRVLSSAETNGCIKVASTANASAYILITANTNAQPDQLATYGLKSDEGETIPNNSLLSSPYRFSAQVPTGQASAAGSLQVAFETKLRRMERQLDLAAAQRSYNSRARNGQIRYSTSVAPPVIGDKATIKVPAKFDASGNSLGGGCNSFTPVTATVQYVSNRAIIYTDDAAPAGGFSAVEFQEIGTEFDNLIYPTDVDYFGTPLDLDTNTRIIILYTPLVNRLTPSGNPGGFVGGFFFAGDLFPSTPPTPGAFACAQSNVGELFYLLAPDPGATINGNRRTTEAVRQGTRGTIAHEFQHMINASERIRHPVTTDLEATWLDEGLAHLAEDLNGRVLKVLNDTGDYTFSQISTSVDDYNAFFFQNFARLQRYLQTPGPNSPTSQFSDSSLADRGAAWALLHFTADHYAPGGDIKAFIKALVPGPDTGVVNLRSHAGNIPFDTLIAGWMIANHADNLGIANLPVKYTYKTYDMRNNVASIVSSRTYPLVVTDISSTGFVIANLQARSGSGNYFRFSRVPGAPARSFRMVNANDMTTAASFTGATFILYRTQ
ncbi:MAG: Ig-like domain-containing protein [Gemmatimonadales bacterium]